MKEYDPHPLSEVFPLMSASDIKDLADDIGHRGLQNPITLYQGKVLDGRHRQEACSISGVKPRYDQYKGEDPLGFVIAANLKRRHLTTSQKAMVAAAMEKEMEIAHGGERKKQDANWHLDRDKISEITTASPRSIARAKAVMEESPKLAEKVRDGKITVAAAVEKLAEKEKEAEAFDSCGHPIPRQCLEYWRRSGEVQELLTAVSRIKSKLETKREEDDVLFRNVSQAAVNELAMAYSMIANAKPYAVCLHCQGKLKDSCRSCHGTGFMAKFTYEHEQVKGARTMREAMIAKGKK